MVHSECRVNSPQPNGPPISSSTVARSSADQLGSPSSTLHSPARSTGPMEKDIQDRGYGLPRMTKRRSSQNYYSTHSGE
jgi:hypothetical protein